MISSIKKWLDGNRDYNEGLALLLKHSRNRAIQHYLTRRTNAKKLAYELGKIANIRESGSRNMESAGISEERVKIIGDGTVRLEDLPESLQEYYRKNVEDYKLMRALHEKMKQAKDALERSGLRRDIVAFDDAITARWAVIDKYVTTGEIPGTGVPDPEAVSGDLTPNSVSALRAMVSRQLAILEKDGMTDGEKSTAIEKLRTAVAKMTDGGQSFSPETLERLKAFEICGGGSNENP